jgi:ATP-dependent helicase HrpB
MQSLPINEVLDDITQSLVLNNRVVLQAPPGAGKTTMVPIALLEQDWLQARQIIMLEPRRLAARSAATRMAYLLGEKVGNTVGYQVRQDSCFSKQTKILVVTEGILTRKLQSDPELSDTALVIFDEFHERSLHADLSLALCLQSQQILREELKILVMSATLNTDAIARLLYADSEQNDFPVIISQGRSYPVDIHYLDHTIKSGDRNQLINTLSSTCRQVIEENEDNCLVFLPGIREISLLQEQLASYLKDTGNRNIIIATLFGNLSKQQQDAAIAPPPAGIRKFVLATNIAETSITIDGISCVIDSGLERVLEYSPASAMNRLRTQFISADSAEQRSGRAGRLTAGHCFRMWTESQQQRLKRHSTAEILHSDLSMLMLELANWGVQDCDELQWMDSPPQSAADSARELLQELSATDEDGRITSHGQAMLTLGTHPRLAHMMISAIEIGQAHHACLIASLLTEKDIYLASAEKSIDIHDRLKTLMSDKDSRHTDRYINKHQCKQVLKTADEFFKRLGASNDTRLEKDKLDLEFSGVLLAFAYPDRIAQQRRNDDASYLLSSGKGATIPEQLLFHHYPYLVIASMSSHSGKQMYIQLAAEITEQQIEQYCSHLITDTEQVSWNDEAQRVESKTVTSLGKINLEESTHTNNDTKHREAVQRCLLQGIKNAGIGHLNWSDKANSLKQRVEFINHYMTELDDAQLKALALPDFSEQWLSENLDAWLQPHLSDENSLKLCQKLDMQTILLSQLSWEQQQAIDSLAPEKITVPSGSSIRIDYSDESQPVLSVRLQEVFGLNDSPSILGGNCKLMMHLLSPARRPMQVTQDLNSFWQTTYHEVKKELRGKYKKHYWPDDPLTATATSKTKKQMDRASID